ncbi:MAG: iron ABC transporter permease [Phycisphaerales bacterium]|nr:iron ABC transporter permease [Phycisphaerales bacterium]
MLSGRPTLYTARSMRRHGLSQILLLAGLLAVLGAVLLYPIWLTVRGGFESQQSGGGYTLYHLTSVFSDPALVEGMVNALLIATLTTLLCLVIAVPLALITARFEFPGKKLLGACVLVPLILPPFVGAIGLHHLLGRMGSLNAILLDLGLVAEPIDFIGRGGLWAIVLIEALHLYPILYLNATAALANLDPTLEEAAENLGASRWRRFVRVVLPLIRPGLFAGATIVFIWSFTELGTPLMFDYQVVTPVQIFNGIKEMSASQQPYALTAIMLFVAVMSYVLGKLVFGGRAYAMYAKASVQASTVRLGPIAGLLAMLAFLGITALAVLPHLGVILVSLADTAQWYGTVLPQGFSLAHYEGALSHELAMSSIRNSLFYASCAVVIDLVVGMLIGYLVVRTRLPGRGLLDALAMLPLAVPGLVMAFGYVAMTLEWPFEPGMPGWLRTVLGPILPSGGLAWIDGGPLHGWADVLGAEPNPVPLLIIAYAVRRLPYVVRATVAGLEQTSGELEEAAMNLGASRLTAVRRVIMPLIMANLIAGALLAFSFAMLEVSDSLILAQREADFPITKAIYVLYGRLGDGQHLASAMGVWGMALLTVTLVGASLLIGKKMGAIFRV